MSPADAAGLLRAALEAIRDLGAWAPVLFVLLYVAASVLFVPASILTLGAGVVFGVALGVPLVSVAATLGATAAFLVGRYLARGWVARKIEGNETFRAIDEAVGREGWKIVVLTRLSPIFPFILLNYAFGITRVRLRDYVLASWLGMLPATVLFVYIGALAGDLTAVGAGERTRTPAEWGLYAAGFLATAAAVVHVTRVARGALGRRMARPGQRA